MSLRRAEAVVAGDRRCFSKPRKKVEVSGSCIGFQSTPEGVRAFGEVTAETILQLTKGLAAAQLGPRPPAGC